MKKGELKNVQNQIISANTLSPEKNLKNYMTCKNTIWKKVIYKLYVIKKKI